MTKLLVNMAGDFYADCTALALERTGNFRVKKHSEPDAETMELQLREFPADVLLLGISVLSGYTVEDRKPLIRAVRSRMPESRIVLFLDERVSEEQTEGVKQLRQARLVDGFLYASNSMDYLVDILETI
jgi:hypothetical protein